jgi:hypothetical protein
MSLEAPLHSEIVAYSAMYGPWLTAGAILLSATVAALFAHLSIRATREMACKRATLDLIQNRELDGDYIEAKYKFNKLRDEDGGLTKWADKAKRNEPEVAAIRTILNGHELVAIGIKEKIIDEELYRRWFRSSLLKDWRKSKAFIEHLRETEEVPRLFIEFEWLADRWGGDDRHR